MKRLLAVVALGFVGTACAGSHGTAARPPTVTSPGLASARTDLEAVHTLTALGDSVPYGTACGCTPYPNLVAADIERLVGHPVRTDNDAEPGYTTSDVLYQLDHTPEAIGDVAHSQAVLLEIGANDIAHTTTCGTEVSCYESKFPNMTKNLQAIVDRLHQIAGSRRIDVVMLDYWNAWLGGRYARSQGPAYVNTANMLTAQLDADISSRAQRAGARYVDLRTAFRGPDHSRDETDLLASDGDHPNAAGHQRIAAAIAAAMA